MAVENFGDTPETFDLDAWIDQGTRPQRTVKVYRDWSLMGELVKLDEQIEAAAQEVDPSPGDVGEEELREQYQEIVGQLAESALEITVRALTDQEVADVAAGIPYVQQTRTDRDGVEKTQWVPDHVAAGDAIAAEAIVSPRMTRDQVRRMREQLGDGPTLVLYRTVTDLRSAGKELPSVPSLPGRSDDSQD